jgi:hypothetical protein
VRHTKILSQRGKAKRGIRKLQIMCIQFSLPLSSHYLADVFFFPSFSPRPDEQVDPGELHQNGDFRSASTRKHQIAQI